MNYRKKIIILSIIILLGIGFAAVVTNLNINGTVSINGNADNFDVIYDTTYIENKAISKVNGLQYTLDNPSYPSTTSMTFSPTNELIAVGDYYEVSYKLLNKSTMYGAFVNIKCGSNSDGTGSISPFTYSGDISNIQIDPQGNYEGKIKFSYTSQASSDATLLFTCKVTAAALSTDATGTIVEELVPKLSTDPLAIYNIVKSKTNSDRVYTTTSIDTVEDTDIDTVYYYKGNYSGLNNNIIFNNMCWKIIRTTETGGTKLIYNGKPSNGKCTTQTGTGTQIGTSKFNKNNNDNAYVGYMYGATGASTYAATHTNTNNSTIKTYIDAWYKTNFVDSNSDQAAKLEDTVFCNDRTISSGSGYKTVQTHYGSYSRSSYYASNPKPTLKCANKNDKFTLNENGNSALDGNEKLTYPVGLITSDEARFAGVTDSTNQSNYLYTGQTYWSLTPVSYILVGTQVSGVYSFLRDYTVTDVDGVRPVVSLKNSTLVASGGEGSTTNPYVVE